MPCTVCQHPRHQEIDQALAAGSATLAELSQKYQLSTSALHRHKSHLQAKVGQAKDQLQNNLRQGCLLWVSEALEVARQTIATARAEGSHKIVLQAMQQGTRLVNIILKQDLPLDDVLVYHIVSSPQWADHPGLLPYNPQIFAASRQTMTRVLSSPCPDGPTVNQSLPQPESQAKPGQNAPEPGPDRASLREKSGKLPGKVSSGNKKLYEYQEDKELAKIFPQDVPCPGSPLLDAIACGRVDIATLNAIGAGRPLPKPLDIFADCLRSTHG